MRLNKTLTILGVAGALLALTPAWATEPPPQKSNGINQSARTVTQRAAAKLQTDLTKDRVRRVQQRAMRDADSDDGTASANAGPGPLPAGEDATR